MASSQRNELSLETEDGLSIAQLYKEILQSRNEVPFGDEPSPRHRSERLVGAVVDQLFDGDDFYFDEEYVKADLDEILLLLVSLRDAETHGKGLMEDLALLLDSRLSPGTVYPRLHDLEDSGVLEMQELVRTKEYRVNDNEEARAMVEHAMRQHLALGFLFYSALHEL